MTRKMAIGDEPRVYGEDYFTDEAVPQDKTAVGQVLSFGAGAQNSSIAVKAVVTEKVTLASGKKLTLALKHSADKTTWKDLLVKEFDAGQEAGEVLMYLVLSPDTLAYTRVDMSTDDGAATGRLDVYPVYIPR